MLSRRRRGGGSGGPGPPGDPGTPGVSPHIGGNGNWFIGATDTGVHAQGPAGGGGGGSGGPETFLFPRKGLIFEGPATTADFTFRLPVNFEIVDIWAYCSEPPTGRDWIGEVKFNGTTIFTTPGNRPRILAGALYAAAVSVPDITTIPGITGVITVEDFQAGSIERGRNRVFVMRYTT